MSFLEGYVVSFLSDEDVCWIFFYDISNVIINLLNPESLEDPKITSTQCWRSALFFVQRELSPVSWNLSTLETEEIFKVSTTLGWGALFTNCTTFLIFLKTGEPLPNFISVGLISLKCSIYLHSSTDLLQINLIVAKCTSSCFLFVPLSLTAFSCHCPNCWCELLL